MQVLAKYIFLAFAKCVLAVPRSHQSALSGCGPGRQIPALDTFYVAKHFLPCPPFISILTHQENGCLGTWLKSSSAQPKIQADRCVLLLLEVVSRHGWRTLEAPDMPGWLITITSEPASKAGCRALTGMCMGVGGLPLPACQLGLGLGCSLPAWFQRAVREPSMERA